MNASASAGDPWVTALPGAYASGSAGNIVGNKLDALISSRSTYAGTDTSGTTTLLSRIGGAITITSGGVLTHSVDTGGIVAASFAAGAIDTYHADIQLTVDQANTKDEYTVTWFKNGVRQTSGITSPTIQVVKRANGADLIASTSMTQIGSTGSYKYDEATNRITAGEANIVVVRGDIDSATRSFSRLVSRDST